MQEQLIDPHSLEFDPSACRAAFSEKLAVLQDQGLVPVITSEGLVGSTKTGGYEAFDMAHRLHDSFPEAKILIVIREQRSMLMSSYSQALKGGITVDIDDYLNPPAKPVNGPFFSMAWLNYDRMVAIYDRLFGEANVLVLPFEYFIAEPEDFTRRIVEFAGAEVPPSLAYKRKEKARQPSIWLAMKRPFNLFIHKTELNGYSNLAIPCLNVAEKMFRRKILDPITPASWSKPWERRWARRVACHAAGYYRDTNKAMARRCGFDLQALGYEV